MKALLDRPGPVVEKVLFVLTVAGLTAPHRLLDMQTLIHVKDVGVDETPSQFYQLRTYPYPCGPFRRGTLKKLIHYEYCQECQ